LPEWARNKKTGIKRISGKQKKREKPNYKSKEKFLAEEEAQENPDKKRVGDILKSYEIGLWFQEQAEEEQELTEGEKLDLCGCATDLYLGPGGYFYLGRVDIPYQECRSMEGEYIDGVGYIVELDHNQLNNFIKQNMPFVNQEWVNELTN
jgi:hypothetical protein